MITLVLKSPGLRDLAGRYATYDRKLAHYRNQELNAFLPKILGKLQGFSPEAKEHGGTFKNSWRGKVTTTKGGSAVRVWNEDPLAPYKIRPTKPHVIRPRIARALSVPPHGVFKKVDHPGYGGSDVMVRAYQEGGMEFVRAMNRAGVKSIQWLEVKR